MRTIGTARIGLAAIGLLMGSLGAFIGIETAVSIPAGPSYAAMGPRVFPGLIGGALCLVGAYLLWKAVHGGNGVDGGSEDDLPYDWPALAWVVGTLASQIALLKWVGWVPAATLLFVGVARAFGSRAWQRDTCIGLVLGGMTYLLFNAVLGLDLPVGLLVESLRGH